MSHECEECGDEFDSERGLHIHQSQKHSDEESDDPKKDITDVGNAERTSGDNLELSLGIKHVGLLGIIFGLAVGFSAGFATQGFLDSTPTQNTKETGDTDQVQQDYDNTPTVENISLEGEPVLGDKDANITIISYEDFQCPYCKVFEDRSFDQLKTQYIDTGKAKLVWKDFPLSERAHPWADDSAEIMECVYRQDNQAFWNIKKDVFDNQKSITEENVKSKILGYASDEGITNQPINSCLKNGNPGEEVSQDQQDARSFDTKYKSQGRLLPFVGSTPSFVVYSEGSKEGVQVVGAQPFPAIKQKIQQVENS